jgi:hypothetical protein
MEVEVGERKRGRKIGGGDVSLSFRDPEVHDHNEQ